MRVRSFRWFAADVLWRRVCRSAEDFVYREVLVGEGLRRDHIAAPVLAHLFIAFGRRMAVGEDRVGGESDQPSFVDAASSGASESTLVGGVMVQVQRDEAKDVAVTTGQRPYLLAQAKRVDLGAGLSLYVIDRLPIQAGVDIDGVPIHASQTSERSRYLSPVGGFEREKDFLKFRVIQVETDTVIATCHGTAHSSAASRCAR